MRYVMGTMVLFIMVPPLVLFLMVSVSMQFIHAYECLLHPICRKLFVSPDVPALKG